MKVGDKIPIVIEVIRPAEDGEEVKDLDGKTFKLCNVKGDKFWAAPRGNGSPILVCDNGETEPVLMRRKAIVDLIENGAAG